MTPHKRCQFGQDSHHFNPCIHAPLMAELKLALAETRRYRPTAVPSREEEK